MIYVYLFYRWMGLSDYHPKSVAAQLVLNTNYAQHSQQFTLFPS